MTWTPLLPLKFLAPAPRLNCDPPPLKCGLPAFEPLKGAGAITIPGLVKIEKKRVPARKAEKGVPNPFKPGRAVEERVAMEDGGGTVPDETSGAGK